MSSPDEGISYLNVSPQRTLGRSGSIMGEKSRSRSFLSKDISVDEGDALKKISQEADEKLLSEKKKKEEARKYLQEMRTQEQAKFSDEESDIPMRKQDVGGVTATSTPLSSTTSRYTGRRIMEEPSPSLPRSNKVQDEDHAPSGAEVKQWKDKLADLESDYKEAMVSQAKLYNEKTALIYQVETLKDRLEDGAHDIVELKHELQRNHSQLLHGKHREESLESDMNRLKLQITYRDNFMEVHGLHLPSASEEDQEVSQLQFVPTEERDKLLKQISELQDELEQAKNSVQVAPEDSLLRGEETKDIVRESTRLVLEYKNKLQLSDAEQTRLNGSVDRLKGQVTRYKTQMEDMEKREDELLKEKRSQSREVRRLQSLVDDLESENELLKRRIEQMRKRQKD